MLEGIPYFLLLPPVLTKCALASASIGILNAIAFAIIEITNGLLVFNFLSPLISKSV